MVTWSLATHHEHGSTIRHSGTRASGIGHKKTATSVNVGRFHTYTSPLCVVIFRTIRYDLGVVISPFVRICLVDITKRNVQRHRYPMSSVYTCIQGQKAANI